MFPVNAKGIDFTGLKQCRLLVSEGVRLRPLGYKYVVISFKS